MKQLLNQRKPNKEIKSKNTKFLGLDLNFPVFFIGIFFSLIWILSKPIRDNFLDNFIVSSKFKIPELVIRVMVFKIYTSRRFFSGELGEAIPLIGILPDLKAILPALTPSLKASPIFFESLLRWIVGYM